MFSSFRKQNYVEIGETLKSKTLPAIIAQFPRACECVCTLLELIGVPACLFEVEPIVLMVKYEQNTAN